MTKNNLLQKLTLAGVVAGAALVAAPMKADAIVFVIDDFNTAPPAQQCVDTTADGIAVICSPTNITGNNVVWQFADGIGPSTAPFPGANAGNGPTINPIGPGPTTRGLSANLISGPDPITTQICSNCYAGHFISGAGSLGSGDWSYVGPSVDLLLQGLEAIEFSYAADHATNIDFEFERSGTVVSLLDIPLAITLDPVTGLPSSSDRAAVNKSILLPINDPQWQFVLKGLTGFKATVNSGLNSSDDLDFTIDNIKLVPVPEPGTVLGLLAFGGLSLGLKRKKQS